MRERDRELLEQKRKELDQAMEYGKLLEMAIRDTGDRIDALLALINELERLKDVIEK